MHKVWERIARWVEKDFSEERARQEAHTRRMLMGLLFLAAMGLALIGTGYMLSGAVPGTYCEYPDPYGR